MAGGFRRSPIDFFQVLDKFFFVFGSDKADGIADHMNNAELNLGLGKNGANSVR